MKPDDRDASDVPETRHPRGDRVHTFQGPGITVTWSKQRCIHAAECVFHLPRVFEPGRRPWIDAAAAPVDRIANVITLCPTGALHATRDDGVAVEKLSPVNTVRIVKRGAIYLRGDIEVVDEQGEVLLRDTRIALCRCGASAHKPLCDAAHRERGFDHDGTIRDLDSIEDPGAPPPPGRLRVIARTNGPLELVGPFELQSADRKTKLAGTSATLCRCGNSANKPFCDGSHERVGFRSDD